MATERTTTGEATTRPKAHNGGEGRATLDAAVREARGALEGGSDERLSVGVALNLGLCIGLLLGGAPRLLIAIALIPLAAMGLTMADRRSRAARTGARATATT